MWLEPASRPALEETLFRFLLTVRDNRPQTLRAMVAERAMLREIVAAPHPDLREAFGHCLNALLLEMDYDMAARIKKRVPALVLGLALAANNCLAPMPLGEAAEADAVAGLYDDFTEALIAALPTARSFNTAIAYHAILRVSARAPLRVGTRRAALMRALIERSPLTALSSLDVHTPAGLESLAAELLPGWQVKPKATAYGWASDEDWLSAVAGLLKDKRIARFVRRGLLGMAETRVSCRNTGLLLEALRRRGESRAFILDFYESYDYFRAQTREREWQAEKRCWPILEEIEKLLRASGDSDAALQLNRRGNEYFLKFRALIETVIAENGVPADYAHLSREFVQSLRPLLAFVTESARQRLSFGAVAFNDAGH
ncbi:MAG TPA: hypothetical protein VF553_01520 [Pyrinomonadaceae bacterium]|jgi:hypothetical protein